MLNILIWVGAFCLFVAVLGVSYYIHLKTRETAIDARFQYLTPYKPENPIVKFYKRLNAPIKQELRKSGLPLKITPERLIILMGVTSFIGIIIGLLLNNFAVALMLGVTGFMLPSYWLKNQSVRRQNRIAELSSVCIHVLITNFHFGVSLSNFKNATAQMPSPIREYFETVVSQLLSGQSPDSVYEDFCEKVESRYLRFALKNILISLTKGTDVLDILFNLMDSVQHEKIRIAKIEKAASEATFMSIVSIGIMLLIIFAYSILSPQFIEVYLTTLPGKIAVTILVGVIIFALYTFEKIKKIEI